MTVNTVRVSPPETVGEPGKGWLFRIGHACAYRASHERHGINDSAHLLARKSARGVACCHMRDLMGYHRCEFCFVIGRHDESAVDIKKSSR